MEREVQTLTPFYRTGLFVLILSVIAGVAFALGLLWSKKAHAAERSDSGGKKRIVYPKHTQLEFEGANIEGVLQNPAEFYFKYRPEEKFDSLVKRRKNFHREMLRDVVLSK